MGRKMILAALGLLALAAPMAFGIVRMIPMHGQILHAQAPLPSFEVVSIRPWKRIPPPPPLDGAPAPKKIMKVDPLSGGERGQSTDRVHMILPIEILIRSAYNLPLGSHRIVGGPDWMWQSIDQYEIQAKIEDSLYAAMQKMTPAQQREQVALMEQSLLAERFKLKIHFETRELPMYALVVAKGGPKLNSAKEGDSSMLSTYDNEQGSGLMAQAITLDQFAQSPLLLGGQVVVDRTGLKGRYDFMLQLEQHDALGTEPGGDDGPSLFTAIQEQLGLKLVRTKGPLEVIAIDHVEKPAEN